MILSISHVHLDVGGCSSDIVPRCHAMVTIVELQRRCIHCSHSKAVNHSSVLVGLTDFLICPTGCLWGTEGGYGTHTVGSHP